MARISYKFKVHADYSSVSRAIHSIDSKCKEKNGGEFKFKIVPGFGYFAIKFVLYMSETNGISTLSIITDGTANRTPHIKAYDKFIDALEKSGIHTPVVTGKPYIVSAAMVGDGTEQRFTNRIGGVATNIETAKVKTVFAKKVNFSIYYSNGMIEYKEVKRNSKLYAELMAKLNVNTTDANKCGMQFI